MQRNSEIFFSKVLCISWVPHINLTELNPKDTGLTFQAARSQAAASVNNAMDFGQLFMSFSFFLITAAIMLISLLFQFTMEKRTKETGTLLAVGMAWSY